MSDPGERADEFEKHPDGRECARPWRQGALRTRSGRLLAPMEAGNHPSLGCMRAARCAHQTMPASNLAWSQASVLCGLLAGSLLVPGWPRRASGEIWL